MSLNANLNSAYQLNLQRFDPATLLPAMYAEDLRRDRVKFQANSTYRKGQVLGEVTATGASAAGTITLAGTSGSFALGFVSNGQVVYTPYLPYNATPAQVQAALTQTVGIGPGGISIGGSGVNLTYAFVGALSNQPQGVFSVDNSRMVGGSVTTAQTTAGVANGAYVPYASGNSDGSQVARCLSAFDCSTDGRGYVLNNQLAAAPGSWAAAEPTGTVCIAGYFNVADLVGLDGGAITSLGRLIQGTSTSGVVRIY